MKRRIDSFHKELVILTHDAFRKHANIVRLLLYDLVEDGDDVFTPALVIERAHYGTLTTSLKQETISESEKLDICWDVTSALFILHKHGVVHGDVKPDNILIFQSSAEEKGRYTAKITDFGSSIFVGQAKRVRYLDTKITNALETIDQSESNAISSNIFPHCDEYSFDLLFLFIVAEEWKDIWLTKDKNVLDKALTFIRTSTLSEMVRLRLCSALRLLLQWDPRNRCADLSTSLNILKPYKLDGMTSQRYVSYKLVFSLSTAVQ